MFQIHSCSLIATIIIVVTTQIIVGVNSFSESDKISSLPQQPKVEFQQYAGYVTVDEVQKRSLFYYFVEAEVEPASKPVVLWLNGGPGCSSVGAGAFVEHGPFKPSKNGLIKNDYSWNKEANMLYLESPAGVGFSYSANESFYDFVNDEMTDDIEKKVLRFYGSLMGMAQVTGEGVGIRALRRGNQLTMDQREKMVQPVTLLKDHQLDAWKAALTQVAGLSGWDSKVTRPENMLIEEIVKDISRKLNLNHSFLNDYQGMIGIEKHIEQIQSLLHLESEDFRVVGIWGMGGIGKTTIARAIYHKLATNFSSRSIILNVGQEVERAGVYHVKNKYISELLGEDSTSSGLSLKSTKALLVLDDVCHSNQVKDLIGTCSNFGEGTRIIVTSRDMQVLKNAEASKIYEVKEMSFKDSLQLFSLNAFKQNYPIEPYVDLSKKGTTFEVGATEMAEEVTASDGDGK
ncbi:unnamed protein product [Vicia faba]|uniref:Uncharacterized protein n=1 Tax=Vicia faba TaxID=3906 RepID=A0AAV0YMV3_VICFA|nr:unnamed protein product [Vicia faba]